MTDIRTRWSEVVHRLRAAESLLILADFEGALVEPGGDEAVPSLTTLSRSLLQSLTRLQGLTLAILGTGAIENLVSRIAIEGIWHVASGGLHLRDPEGGETRFYGPDEVRIMSALHAQLVSQTRQLEGVRIDPGPTALTLYYRRVKPDDVQVVLETFRSVAQSAGPMVMTLHSPGMIEARTRSACDERSAVRYIRRYLKPGALTIYFGRNCRVQDALRDLHPSGIVVEPGMQSSNPSDYSIPDPASVIEALTRLAGDWSQIRTVPGGPGRS